MPKLNELSFRIQQTQDQINKYQSSIDFNNSQMDGLKGEILHLGEVKKLLIRLKNNKMIEKKDFILNTINTALSDVFVDKRVRLDIEASNTTSSAGKINIKYDIVYYENDIEMGRNETLLISIGGGVMSFISILFKILVGYLYSKNKLYIFDESLAEVSELYRPRMAQFLQKFCEVQGFTIILITQTSDIAEYADLAYMLDGDYNDEDVPTLRIEKTMGNIPKENYYYSNIENFQSIKKLSFKYAGFTAIIGKNSIGKSASFRAINSIIYNNYDQKKFPRLVGKSKPGKVLNSKITFGYFSTENDPKNEETQITLERKNAALMFTFDGMEFVGKNLSFEKVKEKIESIGFRYLNLKEQYKNFKGNLKDQTERLAITTQQDGYYLIGDKSTDTAKIFDFLFDSREVTIAIQAVNEDVLDLENTLNNMTLENHANNRYLEHDKKSLEGLMIEYGILLIESLTEIEADLVLVTKQKEILEKKDSTLNKMIEILKMLDHAQYINNYKKSLDTTLAKLNPLCMSYNTLIEILSNIDIINNINNLNSKISQDKQRLDYMYLYLNNYSKLIYYYENIILLENVSRVSDAVETYNNRVHLLSNKINVYDNLIGVSEKGNNLLILMENINRQYEFQSKTNFAKDYNLKLLNVLTISIHLEELKKIMDDITIKRNSIVEKENEIKQKVYNVENLHNQYGLIPCTTCNCSGYIQQG